MSVYDLLDGQRELLAKLVHLLHSQTAIVSHDRAFAFFKFLGDFRHNGFLFLKRFGHAAHLLIGKFKENRKSLRRQSKAVVGI